MTIVLPYQVRQESHKHNSGVVITLGGLQMPATVTPSALQVWSWRKCCDVNDNAGHTLYFAVWECTGGGKARQKKPRRQLQHHGSQEGTDDDDDDDDDNGAAADDNDVDDDDDDDNDNDDENDDDDDASKW